MVPWPIAVLAALYAIPMTWSASAVWMAVVAGRTPVSWALVWLPLSLTVVVGLALMRPWARRLAVWLSTLWMLGAIGSACVAVLRVPAEPKASLIATGIAALLLLLARYLTRPHVVRWFDRGWDAPLGAK